MQRIQAMQRRLYRLLGHRLVQHPHLQRFINNPVLPPVTTQLARSRTVSAARSRTASAASSRTAEPKNRRGPPSFGPRQAHI